MSQKILLVRGQYYENLFSSDPLIEEHLERARSENPENVPQMEVVYCGKKALEKIGEQEYEHVILCDSVDYSHYDDSQQLMSVSELIDRIHQKIPMEYFEIHESGNVALRNVPPSQLIALLENRENTPVETLSKEIAERNPDLIITLHSAIPRYLLNNGIFHQHLPK